MTQTERPTRGFAQVNGTRLYYEVAGDGPPLVMVHAGIADSRMWDDQWKVFAERHRVVRYDMRGFGQSPSVDGAFSHRQDLYALLTYLGIQRAALIGCSRGGATSIDLTLEHPDLIRALILVGAGISNAPASGEPPIQWNDVVTSYNQGNLERTAELEVQIWVDGPQRAPHQVDPKIRERVRQMNLVALKNESLGLGSEQPLEPPPLQRLSEIRVPTLIVVGDQDQPTVIATADLLEQRIAGARKVVMPGTAHLPNMEQPGRFNQIVLDFLSTI
jgi:pimeloyl-ACP methyl ester carboxylesterase